MKVFWVNESRQLRRNIMNNCFGISGNPQNLQNHWNLNGQDGEKLGVISTGVVNQNMFGCFVLFCAIYNYFEKYDESDEHVHFGDLECKNICKTDSSVK